MYHQVRLGKLKFRMNARLLHICQINAFLLFCQHMYHQIKLGKLKFRMNARLLHLCQINVFLKCNNGNKEMEMHSI